MQAIHGRPFNRAPVIRREQIGFYICEKPVRVDQISDWLALVYNHRQDLDQNIRPNLVGRRYDTIQGYHSMAAASAKVVH
jgi:hypothetical protein